jgi:hypothetical protein
MAFRCCQNETQRETPGGQTVIQAGLADDVPPAYSGLLVS